MDASIEKHFKYAGIACIVFSVLSGIAYSLHQWFVIGEILDPIFIGVVMANAIVISQFLKYVIGYFSRGRAENMSNQSKTLLDEAFTQIFDLKRAVVTGFFFGLAFFLATYYFADIWVGQPDLKFSHSFFLFVSNVMTGIAAYCYGQYLKSSFTLGSNVDIGLYDRSCPLALFLIRLNRLLTLAASITSAIAMLSLVESLYEFSGVIYLFSGWIMLVVLSVLIIPLTSISNKVKAIKTENMQKLSKLIETKYEEMITKIQAGLPYQLEADALVDLSRTYKEVGKIRIFPPIASAKSYQTALVAVLVTLIPSIIDLLLGILNGG